MYVCTHVYIILILGAPGRRQGRGLHPRPGQGAGLRQGAGGNIFLVLSCFVVHFLSLFFLNCLFVCSFFSMFEHMFLFLVFLCFV